MNSLVSYQWLSEYVDLNGLTPDEFAQRISLSGPAVEKIHPQGADLDQVVVGHVTGIEAHPQADKLRIALVDVGKMTALKIVCGGSNLKEDQWVAVALVGARVRWHGQGDLIKLEPAEIRGVKSDGMICAANEIGLFDAFPHAEREILDLGASIPELKVKPGAPLAEALGISDDVVMDLEVTSNRVDAMGMLGMAREASAIFRRSLVDEVVNETMGGELVKRLMKKGKGTVPVRVSASTACPRYLAIKISGVKVGPSPWWMKRRLISAGLRPINNIVDISNYVMLELAQPLHMFDASAAPEGITVRFARADEKIQALDGKVYELNDRVLVIANQHDPIAIAGVMGGEASGISEKTTDIIIEAATFDPVIIRRGARSLNLQSDAQQRFEKGLSTQALPFALARAAALVQELAGGTIEGVATDTGKSAYKPLKFSITVDEVQSKIGVEIPKKDMVESLKLLGFGVSVTGKKISATVPWWRDHDIEHAYDLVEEIARIYGYANLPAVIPAGQSPRQQEPEIFWEGRIRDLAKGAGYTETMSYSFISDELARKAGYDPEVMLKVQNPLTADYTRMRTTLLPSLLQVAAENQERSPVLRCFEIANVYYPTDAGWKTLPDEQLEFGAILMGMPEPWRVAKGLVEHLLQSVGIKDFSWKRLSNDSFWHPGRSVQVFAHGQLLGTLGEVAPPICEAFKLASPVACIDLPLETLIKFASATKCYRPIPQFPEAKRDLAVVVDHRVEYDDIERAIRRVDARILSVEWFDTYQGKGLAEGKKSLAVHILFSDPTRTLESAEVDALMEKIVLTLSEQCEAEKRG